MLGAAHYGLSKLYLRTSEMDRSAAAREKAEQEAGAFLRRHGSDEEYSANRYVVDVPVPPARIAAAGQRRRRARRDAALGPGPAPRAAPGLVLALGRGARPWSRSGRSPCWSGRLAPARACERCGRPACRRCDGAAAERCGQCVNVFERKGVVDVRDWLRKEAGVRRHDAVARAVTTGPSRWSAAGAGQVFHGAPIRGAALLLAALVPVFVIAFWRGVAPPPYPSPHALAAKLAVAVPLGLAIWALAVRDAFRRTRS